MRIHTRVAFCLWLAWLSPLHAQQPQVKGSVLRIENKLLNAYVHRDLNVRDRYVADDFMGVDNDGNVYNKQQDIQDLKDGTFTMKSFKLEDVQVRRLGDTAIVTGMNTANTVYKGKEETGIIRFADTFHKRNGRWQLVYSQDTGVSEDAKNAQAAEDKEVENQIVALEKSLWTGNADDVRQLESDDYEAIKHAHRYTRADDEAAAKDVKFVLVAMDDTRVRMLGSDIALVTYHATEKGSFRGTEVPPSLYFGSLWVKRNGEWKNVFVEENLPDAFTATFEPGTQ